MRPTRRQLLAGLAASPVALSGCKDGVTVDSGVEGAPERSPEPARWVPEAPVDEAVFAWALVAGDVTTSGVELGLRTEAVAVDLVLMRADGEGWVEDQRIDGVEVVEGWMRATLDGLLPDTAYCVAAFADGARSEVTRLRSAIAPGAVRQLSFGASSCLGSSNPGWGSLAVAGEAELDFFLMLGDLVYADGSQTVEDYRAFYERALSQEALRALAASTSFIATWDDHEVANNWVLGENITAEQLDDARRAFREAMPQQEGPEGGLWRALSWGDVLDVFVLDCRGERVPSEDRMISDAQMAWIQEALESSAARFKVLLMSVHFTDHSDFFGSLMASDRWQGFEAQRSELRDHLAATPGVFLVTGDMHYGALQLIDPPGVAGEHILEVAAGPAGSFVNPVGEIYEQGSNPQYPYVTSQWTYARFDLDPVLGTLRVRLINDLAETLTDEVFAL